MKVPYDVQSRTDGPARKGWFRKELEPCERKPSRTVLRGKGFVRIWTTRRRSTMPAMPLPFTIRCSDGWCDITDEIEAADPPWTLAKPDGVGAFQFSLATYKSGRIPNPSPQVLLSLLRDFASSQELGEPAEVVTEDRDLRIAAGSFRHRDDFVRAWYASDGRSFAKVTYTCVWSAQQAELPDCERMIRSLRFTYEAEKG
jgi:hypothetical protein